MSRLRALFAKWKAESPDPSSPKNRGNFGNRCNRNEINDLTVTRAPPPRVTTKPLKLLRLHELPRLPAKNESADVRPAWWRDPIELRARFDEIAGQLEFDHNLDRDAAERTSHACLTQEICTARVSDRDISFGTETNMEASP